MRILVLSDNVGRTAPGIVYERIINGLSFQHEIKLITSDFDSSSNLNNNVIFYEIPKRQIPTRVNKLLISFFSTNIFDQFWAKKVIKFLKLEKSYSPDIILSLISNNHYSPLIAGNRLSDYFGIKHFTYSVDAIPAPIGWLKNDSFYRGTNNLIAKQLEKVDGLFSANKLMLEYQLKIFEPKIDIVTEVIYNPTTSQLFSFEKKNKGINTFLYAGGIYGPRKVIYIFLAFKKLLKLYPNSTLEFVGSIIPKEELSIFSNSEKEKIIFHPFLKDLRSFFERATALIDIDSDLENDIFLSSKIINYLSVNRIIISETGKNSPSRKIFQNIPSIIQCDHNPDELTEAMVNSIVQQNYHDFEDRSEVLKLFQIGSIIKKMNYVFGLSLLKN